MIYLYIAALHDLLTFSMAPNLRHIFIDLSDDSLIIPFLQNLHSNNTKVHSLKLGLAQVVDLDAVEDTARHMLNWPVLDQLLSDSTRFPNLSRLAFYLRGVDHSGTRVWERMETEILTSTARLILDSGMQRVLTKMGSEYAIVTPNAAPSPRSREAVVERLEQTRIRHEADMVRVKQSMMDDIRSFLPRIMEKVEVVLGEPSDYE
jgi:hypothetical protein